MADIKITNLTLSGIDLFGDSESFLQSLSEEDLGLIQGGATYETVITNTCTLGCTKKQN